MTKRIITGNEAVALGALRAGVRVVTGYPGTPSTGCLSSLLEMDLPDRHVEWSTNEKVAFEIAAGAAWAGHRAMCTMKMTGVNVAYDALISIAHSGTNGGLVIYVADDPGVIAGMAEQDSRGFALMSDLPVLEPASPADAYELTQTAFELSEAVGTPVFLRLTTATALTHSVIECRSLDELTPLPPATASERAVLLEKDIARYTKAGSKICKEQHAALIGRLELAREWLAGRALNRLSLSEQSGGLGVVSVGAVSAYLQEALDACQPKLPEISTLRAVTTVPFPVEEAKRLLEHCGTILVLEELEPHFERALHVAGHQLGFEGRIVGKLDGTLSRVGEYGVKEILAGLEAVGSPADSLTAERTSSVLLSDELSVPRPITVCAGCPHRGTYLAIEAAISKAGYSKDEVMVTGDIGCTILGMNPPFDLLWTEVSMGSSVSLAQGYVHAGIATPVIATIGDSTFFHGGIPGLLNAIQHNTPMTLVIMDNGWTSMTGMQVNAGTDARFQPEGARRIDLAKVVEGLGPDRFEIVDPYEVETMTSVISQCLASDGVKVVLARQECAIQAQRRGVKAGRVTVIEERCVLCKKCLRVTGCPALGFSATDVAEKLGEPATAVDGSSTSTSILIDVDACNGCGICVGYCPTNALVKEDGNSRALPRELLGEGGNSRMESRELLGEGSAKADPSPGSEGVTE